MIGKWWAFRRDEAGSVAIPFAISLILLLGLAALVIDIGHARVVKREIQDAAEAGAMAGARAMAYVSGAPNFANGKTVATTAVQSNYANGALLSDFNSDGSLTKVQSGYWDTSWTTTSAPANLNGYTDPAHYAPSATEYPAVKVTIDKTARGVGSSAPVTTYFAPILGVNSLTMHTQAVAILFKTGPKAVPPNSCFPLAAPKSWVDNHWSLDPPVSFRIGSGYQEADGGDWTSFKMNANDASTIDTLIDKGNPTTLAIGDLIWIEPGVKNSVYNYAAELQGKTMLMPVVPDNFDTHSQTPILGFVAFYFEDSKNGSNPYIQGHFVKNFNIANATPGGPNNGATVSLVKVVQ